MSLPAMSVAQLGHLRPTVVTSELVAPSVVASVDSFPVGASVQPSMRNNKHSVALSAHMCLCRYDIQLYTNILLQPEMPSFQVYSKKASPGSPHLPNQEPPGAQQVSLPAMSVAQLGHLRPTVVTSELVVSSAVVGLVVANDAKGFVVASPANPLVVANDISVDSFSVGASELVVTSDVPVVTLVVANDVPVESFSVAPKIKA